MDAILTIIVNVVDGMHVWPNVIASRVMAEVSEREKERKKDWLLLASFYGNWEYSNGMRQSGSKQRREKEASKEWHEKQGDRQILHEAIREHSMAAGFRVKHEERERERERKKEIIKKQTGREQRFNWTYNERRKV